MRKTGTIAILALLFYTQFGYYGQFMFIQWRLKEAAREAWIASLPDAALYRIRLTDVNETGKWEEEGKECWYREHLYDVIRQKTIACTVWLYCLDDEREARLIRQSGEVTRANHDHPDKKAGHSLSIRSGDVVWEPAKWCLTQPVALRKDYLSCSVCPLPTFCTEIVIPPPKS